MSTHYYITVHKVSQDVNQKNNTDIFKYDLTISLVTLMSQLRPIIHVSHITYSTTTVNGCTVASKHLDTLNVFFMLYTINKDKIHLNSVCTCSSTLFCMTLQIVLPDSSLLMARLAGQELLVMAIADPDIPGPMYTSKWLLDSGSYSAQKRY